MTRYILQLGEYGYLTPQKTLTSNPEYAERFVTRLDAHAAVPYGFEDDYSVVPYPLERRS